jgi:hypothetical protein
LTTAEIKAVRRIKGEQPCHNLDAHRRDIAKKLVEFSVAAPPVQAQLRIAFDESDLWEDHWLEGWEPAHARHRQVVRAIAIEVPGDDVYRALKILCLEGHSAAPPQCWLASRGFCVLEHTHPERRGILHMRHRNLVLPVSIEVAHSARQGGVYRVDSARGIGDKVGAVDAMWARGPRDHWLLHVPGGIVQHCHAHGELIGQATARGITEHHFIVMMAGGIGQVVQVTSGNIQELGTAGRQRGQARQERRACRRSGRRL